MPPYISIRIQPGDFDLAAEVEHVRTSGAGAVVSFSGICRDEGGRLAALELEHYPGMAEAEIRRIAETAAQRWPVSAMTVVHRHGRLKPGENIVLVVAAAEHRQAAFDAAGYLMDFLKTRAPFWKKEHLFDGTCGSWVLANEADEIAAQRWKIVPPQ